MKKIVVRETKTRMRKSNKRENGDEIVKRDQRGDTITIANNCESSDIPINTSTKLNTNHKQTTTGEHELRKIYNSQCIWESNAW